MTAAPIVTPGCEACAAHSGGTSPGETRAGCRQCLLRELALSPGFAASMASRSFDPRYKAALISAAGAAWENLHREVKAWESVRVTTC